MAILNITSDSFFADSRMENNGDIESRVREIINQGAAIIDVGGYSSRPGAQEVSVEQEWERVHRGIAAVRAVDQDITISIDTFRSEIVRRCVAEFGNIVVNDISAGELDKEMINTVAELKLPYIAMHMRGRPETMQTLTSYQDITQEVVDYFKDKVTQLKAAGVETIILDPGFGFAKSLSQNYELLKGLHSLVELGYPVLSGVSRKSMIYKLLDTTPEQALAGTIAIGWESLRQGATILRVHDVQEAVDSVKIFNEYNKY